MADFNMMIEVLAGVLAGFVNLFHLNSIFFEMITRNYLTRRRLLMRQIAACSHRLATRKRKIVKAKRSIWSKPDRCSGWWSNLRNGLMEDEEEWRLNFRM